MKCTMWIKQLVHRCSQVLLVIALLMGSAPLPTAVPPPGELPPQPQPAQADSQATATQVPALARPGLPQSSQPISTRDVIVEPSSPAPSASPTSNLQPASPFNSAYVTDVDLGDGRRQAIVSSSPVNYQAEDGSWQPIDPRFEVVEGGFVNRTNLLQVSAGDRQAVLRLRSGNSLVGWEPQAVALTTAAGDETVLAEPLDAAESLTGTLAEDGRTVHYSQNWTLPGLSEEIASGPGQVEQSLVFARRPDPHPTLPLAGEGQGGGEGEFLTLHATLHLLPGATLYAEGKKQTGAFITAGEVQVRDAQGQAALTLAPVRAFEQAHPNVGVAGRYRLAPQQEGEWQVAVDTPWDWWADPERAYPVVIDPRFQVKGTTHTRHAHYDPVSGGYIGLAELDPDLLQLGQHLDCIRRLLVQFPLPTLPPQATIDEARLEAWPENAYNFYEASVLSMNIELCQLSSDVWTQDPPPAGVQPQCDELLTPISSELNYSRGDPSHSYASWNVTDWVRGWRTSWDANKGFMLKIQAEPCTDVVKWQKYEYKSELAHCGNFSFPNPADYTPDDGIYPQDMGHGLRLVVRYTAWLAEGTIYTSPDPPKPYTGIPSGGDNYYNADHEYLVPALPGDHWQALVVRGQGNPVGVCPPVSLEQKCERPLQGRLPMTVLDENDQTLAHLTPDPDKVGFFMLDSRGHPGRSPRLRVGRTDLANEVQPVQYDVRLIGERGSLSVGAADQSSFVDYDFASSTPMALWNISMPSGTNSRVDVKIVDSNIEYKNKLAYYQEYAPWFRAYWFKSDDSPVFQGKTELSPPPEPSPDMGGVRMNTLVEPENGAKYALALVYDGPSVDAYECSKQHEGLCTKWEVFELAFTVRVRVTSCPEGKLPLANGTCQAVVCPNAEYDATRYQEKGGLGLWSESGWDGNSSQWPGDAPMLGGLNHAVPTVAVLDSKVTYSGDDVTITPAEPDSQMFVVLVNCGSVGPANNNPISLKDDAFKVFDEYPMHREEVGGGPALVPDDPSKVAGSVLYKAWPEPDRKHNLTNEQFYIVPGNGTARATALFQPVMQGDDSGSYTISAQVQWWLKYGGWPSLTSSTTRTGTPTPPTIAGMILDLGDYFNLDTPAPYNDKVQERVFRALRATDATIAHQPELGGASRPVKALISMRGQSVGTSDCPMDKNCVDLRATDDMFPNHENRIWQMPDIHTNAQAGMVALSTVGKLHVFSADHPAASGTQAAAQEFSFDTYGGSVSVEQEPCYEGGDPVTVIRGETRMTMPNIGNANDPGSVISVKFKLCQNKLRDVRFQFHSPVGIPIGSSGLFATGLAGTVTIDPGHTTIEFGMDFQAAQGGDGGIFKGHGQVKISTAGYFEFSGAGKLLGTVDADGKLWVAWSPLDVGLEMNLRYGGWLSGLARLHMWEGQGWQHKYSWLPDNDEKHLSALFAATIHIEQGAAFSWWFIDIPPDDIDFRIEIAFGEFCTNASCTSYEWGVKGKFSVCGYDVGLYYGFRHGFSFILGNDGHVLIDQYGGAATAHQTLASPTDRSRTAGAADRVTVRAASPMINGTVVEPITVTADTESLLVGLSWQAGSPQLVLYDAEDYMVKGDGIYYTVQISETANVTDSAYSRLMGVQLKYPRPGTWHAVISNLTGKEHYKFIYFLSKGAPGTRNNPGRFIDPGTEIEDGTGAYTITWEVPPGTSPSATISLDYTKYHWIDNISTYWNPDDMGTDVPIVKNLPFNTGSYRWDTSGLASGHYGISAVVNDGVNDFPPGSICDPDDPCQSGSELPPARAFDANRFPGLSTFESFTQFTNPNPPGLVAITDTVAPPAPTGLTLNPIDRGILACWDPLPDSVKDVAAYLVQWGERSPFPFPGGSWVGGEPSHAERVTAVTTPTLRIGGLKNDLPIGFSYGVIVSGIDASGNVGPSSSLLTARPTSNPAEQVPFAPISLTVHSQTSEYVRFSWQPAATGPTPCSYRLVYQWLTPTTWYADTFGHVETNLPFAFVYGLHTGATYKVSVSAANSEGWHSASSDPIEVTVTDGVDGDGDGMPDDWEAAHNLAGPFIPVDVDDDGLTNLEEYQAGTNPREQDSDADGFSDTEEAEAGTNPLDATSYPAQWTQPRLALETHYLSFYTKKGMTETATSYIKYYNTGGGDLVLAASSASSWITPTIVNAPMFGYFVKVSVDTRDLQSGYHAGIVRVYHPIFQGDPLIGGPQCIRVEVWVSPADDDVPVWKLHLPLVIRNG